MFSMTGLSRAEVTILKDEHHIYLLPSGRLSVTGCKLYLLIFTYGHHANVLEQ